MTELIDTLKDSRYSKTTENKLNAFYNYMHVDYILGPIIEKHEADYEIIKMLILRLDEAVGGHYGGWCRGQYIPVSTFGFSESL